MAKLIRQREIKPKELIALSFEQLDQVNPSFGMNRKNNLCFKCFGHEII